MKLSPKAALILLVGAVVLVVAIIALRGLNTAAPAPTTHGPTGRGATSHPASHPATAKPSSGRTTSSGATDPATGLPWINAADLPPEARDTLRLIDRGGPYPYPNNDGVVFSNAEGHLPKQRSGYYHEYTVPTPGASTRGARRIVTGSDGEFFYTGDHYDSFARIRR